MINNNQYSKSTILHNKLKVANDYYRALQNELLKRQYNAYDIKTIENAIEYCLIVVDLLKGDESEPGIEQETIEAMDIEIINNKNFHFKAKKVLHFIIKEVRETEEFLQEELDIAYHLERPIH